MKLGIIYICLLDIVFKFEGECGMNIFDDDYKRNNQETGHCHGKCQGIANLLINELAM